MIENLQEVAHKEIDAATATEKKSHDSYVIARAELSNVLAANEELVDKAELDYVQDLMGSYFSVSNPNATASCGCGTSFSV